MKPINLIALLIIFLESCSNEPENYSYSFLRRQLTPDRKHYVYWYERPGPMAFSSDYYGLQIMRMDEPFKEREGLELSGEVNYWLGKDTLVISSNTMDNIHAHDTLPIKTTYEKYDNIIVKHVHDHAGTGGGVNKYTFDSLAVSNNLIAFFGIEPRENSGRTTMRYPLGAISVESSEGIITKVELSKNYKSMRFTRIDESGKTLHNQPEIGSDLYVFAPTRDIPTKSLGEVGIFFDYKPKSD